jgi:hypothetical protein
MEQVKRMFYAEELPQLQIQTGTYYNKIYDNKTILPLKYKQGPKAYDNDVESPHFTPLIFKTRSNSPSTTSPSSSTIPVSLPITTPTKKIPNKSFTSTSSTLENLYCDNV